MRPLAGLPRRSWGLAGSGRWPVARLRMATRKGGLTKGRSILDQRPAFLSPAAEQASSPHQSTTEGS